MKQSTRGKPRGVRPFDKSGRKLTCAICNRTMALAQKRMVRGQLRDVCRPCRGES